MSPPAILAAVFATGRFERLDHDGLFLGARGSIFNLAGLSGFLTGTGRAGEHPRNAPLQPREDQCRTKTPRGARSPFLSLRQHRRYSKKS